MTNTDLDLLNDLSSATDSNPEQRAFRDSNLSAIAENILEIETLEARNRDRLDYKEVAIWDLRLALEIAYEAGKVAATRFENSSK